jgi:hypothetical protein
MTRPGTARSRCWATVPTRRDREVVWLRYEGSPSRSRWSGLPGRLGVGMHPVGHGGVVTTRSKWQADLPEGVPTRQIVRLGPNRAERRRHAKRVLATAGACCSSTASRCRRPLPDRPRDVVHQPEESGAAPSARPAPRARRGLGSAAGWAPRTPQVRNSPRSGRRTPGSVSSRSAWVARMFCAGASGPVPRVRRVVIVRAALGRRRLG